MLVSAFFLFSLLRLSEFSLQFISSVVWSDLKSSRLLNSHLVPHPYKNSFAVVGNVAAQKHDSLPAESVVAIYATSSPEPIRTRSLHFSLSTAIWYPDADNTKVLSDNDDFSLLAVTADRLLVALGDSVTSKPLEGSAARAISSEDDLLRPTLFQDIFGKSAFLENAGESSDLHARPKKLDQEPSALRKGVIDLKVLDGPAHLLPPISTLFDSLMESFSNPSTSKSSEFGFSKSKKEEDIILTNDTSGDVEMADGDSASPAAVGVGRKRRVNEQEMEIFTELFRTLLTSRTFSPFDLLIISY